MGWKVIMIGGTVSHQIVLNIPDEIYQPLEEQAEKAGKSPATIINELLTRMIQLRRDPLRRLAGAFTSGVPDPAEHHHEHLGHGLVPCRHCLHHGLSPFLTPPAVA